MGSIPNVLILQAHSYPAKTGALIRVSEKEVTKNPPDGEWNKVEECRPSEQMLTRRIRVTTNPMVF